MNTKKLIMAFIAVLFTVTASAQRTTMYLMKDNKVTHAVAIVNIDSIIFYNPVDPADPTQDVGVVINGVKWATRNVNAPGSFAASPESLGMFYQWDRQREWPAMGYVDPADWGDSNISESNTWHSVNDPSPAGWRVPTQGEIEKLVDQDKVTQEWTVENGENGMRFTDKETGNSIFLPAAGFRHGTDGVLYEADRNGWYWSSSVFSLSYAFGMRFGASEEAWRPSFYRSTGASIRPVVAE